VDESAAVSAAADVAGCSTAATPDGATISVPLTAVVALVVMSAAATGGGGGLRNKTTTLVDNLYSPQMVAEQQRKIATKS